MPLMVTVLLEDEPLPLAQISSKLESVFMLDCLVFGSIDFEIEIQGKILNVVQFP